MAHHPVYGLRAGMNRATVLARLGPPARSVTSEELVARYRPVIAGDLPSNDETWLYEDKPPGHTLGVVIGGGVLTSVGVEVMAKSGAAPAPDASSGGTARRRIRIDKDGIFAWTPDYALLLLIDKVKQSTEQRRPPQVNTPANTTGSGLRQPAGGADDGPRGVPALGRLAGCGHWA
jgi:hypothetical protein